MDTTVREFVRCRARYRCEYCLLKQEHLPFSTFHIEHIIPRKHGGDNNPVNLAMACNRCNLFKGSNLTGIDPQTGAIVPLFNPRVQVWEEHFRLSDITVVGLTAIGRTTVRVLNINESRRVRLRATLKSSGQL